MKQNPVFHDTGGCRGVGIAASLGDGLVIGFAVRFYLGRAAEAVAPGQSDALANGVAGEPVHRTHDRPEHASIFSGETRSVLPIGSSRQRYCQ